MSDTFNIGKKVYKTPKPGKIASKSSNVVRKLSKELEIARTEGKYSRLAIDLASELPKDAYKVIEDYLKKHNRKVYGGMALNMYLPKEQKIYKRGVLPDYDFFSPEPWKDAVNISDLLYKKGFLYTEAKAGIHKGTFKVFANFWPVADITYLPPELYDQITTRKKNGFTLVSPAYLQMAMYNIISKPIESPVRWPNVAFRQKLLEKWVPLKFKKKQCAGDFINESEKIKLDPNLELALDIVYKQARKEKLIYGGALAYNKYVSIAGGQLRLPVYYYELYAQDAGQYADTFRDLIAKAVDKELISDVIYQPYKDMNGISYILYMDLDDAEVPIFSITELTRCIPYKYLNGRYYCAIDYLFYELYNQMFNEETNLYAFDVSCLIRYLYYLQQQYYRNENITELDDSPLQRFVTKCRGPFVDVVRKEFYSRWLDRVEAREKIVDILPTGDNVELKGVKNRKVRVYPVSEDLGLTEEECYYPYAWSEELNRCANIPITGYQPNQPQPLKVSAGKSVNLKKKQQ